MLIWEDSPLGPPLASGRALSLAWPTRWGSLAPLALSVGQASAISAGSSPSLPSRTRSLAKSFSYSHRDLHPGPLHPRSRADFLVGRAPSYSAPLFFFFFRGAGGLGGASAIHLRARPIRLVSCYTLLSRFRLPWPLPSCYYGATPFVGLLRHRGRPRLFCHSCLPGWPTSPPHARPSAFDDTPPRGPLVSSAATAFRCLFGGPLSWEKFRREPATSALVWSFAPLRSSHKRLAAQHCSGPPALFPAPSSWPRKDRALSGRPGRAPPSSCLSVAPLLGTRYRSACALARCRLARPWHSSVRVSRRAVPLPPLFLSRGALLPASFLLPSPRGPSSAHAPLRYRSRRPPFP